MNYNKQTQMMRMIKQISYGMTLFFLLFTACSTDDIKLIEEEEVEEGEEIEWQGFIINEVLYDPSNAALDGDANGDGVYSQAQDEFIEFYNHTPDPIDLSGYKVFDASALTTNTPRHIFPANTILESRKALVLFGGGTPTGDFGGAIVMVSTTGDLNMNNEADVMTIKNAADSVILTFDITPLHNNPNESYTRNPDITGDFVRHNTVNGRLFSPGTKVDGTSF